ncbi:Small polypeptide DEVIL 17 [Linum grandiflorum]
MLVGRCLTRQGSQRVVVGEVDGGSGGGRHQQPAGCMGTVREQRSRFYVARRCVVMLLCWHKYGKS